MALDDRDYYREELARKRGVPPPRPLGQPVKQAVTPTPLLDAMLGEPQRQPTRWAWLIITLASVVAAEAAWVLHYWPPA